MVTLPQIMKKDILLVTLNSTYQHTAFGLRYLHANMGELRECCEILEFTTAKEVRDIAEQILAREPHILGLGVYIWNTRPLQELVALLKRVRPDLTIVLGGPEVSHESESQLLCQQADYVIKGEADFLFYEFCRDYFAGQRPEGKYLSGPLPEIQRLASPYPYYRDEDIRNRYVYVEASRGCPYKCEYCLSSLDKSVRAFETEKFLADLQGLIERGARNFKFIDRTFNLSVATCTRILGFFLERIHLGLFLHFEMVPDRLPLEIRELLGRFPPGALQFEIGIQTWNPEVARLVSRRNDYAKVRDNFRFLREHTGVHTHADLIVGLPGEDIESFARGFDELASLEPDEIQVGILKRLKGTPIVRHDREWQMIYHEHPPFQILSTKKIDFSSMQKMNRFAKHWDLYANSGRFKNFMACLRARSQAREDKSFFWQMFDFSEFLSRRHEQHFALSLLTLTESALAYLSGPLAMSLSEARAILARDYQGDHRRDLPRFLKEAPEMSTASSKKVRLNKRQDRHLQATPIARPRTPPIDE